MVVIIGNGGFLIQNAKLGNTVVIRGRYYINPYGKNLTKRRRIEYGEEYFRV